jgi:hypothetical protein
MGESITITEAETGPDAPLDNSSERPEWLPEKFNSAEDMAKSYSELEKKLSGGTSEDKQEQEEAPSETDDQPKDNGSPDFTKFSEEFSEKGELTDDSFKELETMGYPKEMVEAYIRGTQQGSDADVSAVMEVAGGTDGYKDLTEWASENVQEAELKLYNQMVETGTDNAKMAVEWLMSKREGAEGVEPNLLSGKSKGAPKDEYRSTAEVVAAMKDTRYGKDTAYTKDVEEKLGRSSVF